MPEPDDRFTEDQAARIVADAIDRQGDDPGHLSRSEVESIAQGVGVGPDIVDAAIRADAQRREEEAARRERRRRRAAFGLKALGFMMVATVMRVAYVACAADVSMVEVQRARSRVDIAIANLGATATLTDDPAELASLRERAKRRVYVAERDYDTVAASYNAVVRRSFARWVLDPVPYANALWVRPAGTRENDR